MEGVSHGQHGGGGMESSQRREERVSHGQFGREGYFVECQTGEIRREALDARDGDLRIKEVGPHFGNAHASWPY